MGFFTDSNRDLKEAGRRAAENARQRAAQAAQEQENQRRAAEDAQARARQEAEAVKRARQERREGYLNKASGYAAEKMKASGINDQYGLGAYFQNLLNTRAAALGDDSDLSSLDPESVYAQAYNDVREGARRSARGKVDEFAGADYGRAQFADTSDDTILDAILNTQYVGAREAIDRAKSRGQLNAAGYTAAGADLETTKGTARTKLEDTGLGVLSRYRDDLNTRVEDVRSRARNLDLGDNIDFSALTTGIGEAAAGYRNRMEGDLRTAAEGMDFFDTANLLGRASTGQGFNNPGRKSPLAAAFSANQQPTEDDREKGRQRRAMGNVGAF